MVYKDLPTFQTKKREEKKERMTTHASKNCGKTTCNTTCRHKSYRKGHRTVSFRVPLDIYEEFRRKHTPSHRSAVLRRILVESLADGKWLELQEVDLARKLLVVQAELAKLKLEQRRRNIELEREVGVCQDD